MKTAIAIIAAAILLAAPPMTSAQGASSPQGRTAAAGANAALTASDFRSKASEEQTDILFNKLATLKKNLWSETYPDGRKKPARLLANHRQIVDILEMHFKIADRNRPPLAWLDLFSAIDKADDTLLVDQIIMAHVRQIVQQYEARK